MRLPSAVFSRDLREHVAFIGLKTIMTKTVKLALVAGAVAGIAAILCDTMRRRGPSALSETLEHEDATDETEMGVDDMFDARIAPGAPL